MPTYPLARRRWELLSWAGHVSSLHKKRHKDGKEHIYWSIVENRRVSGGRVLQRHVLYLGELNGRQEASWQKTIDLFAREGDTAPQQISLPSPSAS